MIFHPLDMTKKDGCFVIPKEAAALAHSVLHKPVIREFFSNFCFQVAQIRLSESEEFIFKIGSTERIPLGDSEYTIRVTEDGICLFAKSEKDLLAGFMTLLDRIRATDTENGTAAIIDCCEIRDQARIQNRMVHFCVFPETELWELERFLRFSAALRFTHVIVEFWGMLQYNCLEELSWPFSYSKEQIRPIFDKARDLGLEIIPMFNHWGHASACRVMHGKHVVLDQNPSLQPYFSDDGWCWNIKEEKTLDLLRSIRNELIELCGEGKYFHIGCDEAYGFDFSKESMDALCGFINGITEELCALGRRPIAWGDMLLHRRHEYNEKNSYIAFAPSVEAEGYMQSNIDKRLIIADWQYYANYAPIETSLTLKKAGFDVLLCPFDETDTNAHATATTVREHSLLGYIHTTWHTLSTGMPRVTLMALGGIQDISELGKGNLSTKTAAILRKAIPIRGDYERAGWSKFEVSCRW